MNKEIIYGFHSINALLEARPRAFIEVVYAGDRHDKRLNATLEALEGANIKVTPTSREKLNLLLPDVSHQGIAAMVRAMSEFGEDKIDEILENQENPLFLILDGVTDPHNLGACLRTADAAGVAAVIVPKDKSASLTATARKISSGASEVVPVIKVTNLARTMRYLQDNYVWIVGTAGEAEDNIYNYDFPKSPLALVMGNEGTGMRRLTRENCDALVKIPMLGLVSSLNVSVATGVCLFEIVRQLKIK